MINPAFRGWRETYNNIGSVSGSTTIDFANGNYQKITSNGVISLDFTFPGNAANQNASIVVWIDLANTNHTVTLPSQVIYGHEDILGISSRVITFPEVGDYFLEFSTVDSGAEILVRDLARNYVTNIALGKYAHHTVANADVISVNSSVKTYHIDSTSSVIRSNVLIVLPNSAPDGQEVTLSFHTPVTECWITNVALDTDAVKWVANNVAASGNVSVDLVYSTTVDDGRWLRT